MSALSASLHLHKLLIDVVLVMLLAHGLADLIHLVVLKDDGLRRMLPLRGD